MSATFTCPRCWRSDAARLVLVAVTMSASSYRAVRACEACIEVLRREARRDSLVVVEWLEEEGAA